MADIKEIFGMDLTCQKGGRGMSLQYYLGGKGRKASVVRRYVARRVYGKGSIVAQWRNSDLRGYTVPA